MNKVRVRFAPSPTGGLHLGGVRTALFNYLFAKKHNGDFVLRIEDTDQTRYVEGAEKYILDCLNWCGINPNESPANPGSYGPYRQSERKSIYREYAEKLIKKGHAYYAFDTPEEIEEMRNRLRLDGEHNLQYGYHNRYTMRNSLTLSEEQTKELLEQNVPYVIRIKVERDHFVRFHDMIHGDLEMSTNSVDDKVLLKADGMPTYHLAVVVDDHLMEITHAFRGEEWLPSAPVHVLLYQYFGWESEMPQWAHLPLILKPDGNGKLSKRDGERLGFPVFALEWNDPVNGLSKGFKELGFLPEAFLNMLAMIGWNDGSEQEIFSLEELEERFSMDKVQSHGAKFDFEKGKWFNHEWIKKSEAEFLYPQVHKWLTDAGFETGNKDNLLHIISMVKERCTLMSDFIPQSAFFFKTPDTIDIESIKPKWDEKKYNFFSVLNEMWTSEPLDWNHESLNQSFKTLAAENGLKPGELMLPLRIMLVGGKFGPGVFEIAEVIGRTESAKRITNALDLLK